MTLSGFQQACSALAARLLRRSALSGRKREEARGTFASGHSTRTREITESIASGTLMKRYMPSWTERTGKRYLLTNLHHSFAARFSRYVLSFRHMGGSCSIHSTSTEGGTGTIKSDETLASSKEWWCQYIYKGIELFSRMNYRGYPIWQMRESVLRMHFRTRSLHGETCQSDSSQLEWHKCRK